jgi:hypothetical protein
MKILGNIYGNRSQSCRLRGKTYKDTQLGELVHSVVVEHTSEHGVAYRGEPIGEKREEGETSVELQPPCASG